MLTFLVWLFLLLFCWPLAIVALVLYPIVWLLLLPFRLLGITIDGLFALLRAVVMLPARVLGGTAEPHFSCPYTRLPPHGLTGAAS
jgi:hypothetical protein